MVIYSFTLLHIVYNHTNHLLIVSFLFCDTLYVYLFFCGLGQKFFQTSEKRSIIPASGKRNNICYCGSQMNCLLSPYLFDASRIVCCIFMHFWKTPMGFVFFFFKLVIFLCCAFFFFGNHFFLVLVELSRKFDMSNRCACIFRLVCDMLIPLTQCNMFSSS